MSVIMSNGLDGLAEEQDDARGESGGRLGARSYLATLFGMVH